MTTSLSASPMQQPATWNAIASGYAGASGLFSTFTEQALGRCQALQGARVLEVACGPGGLSREAARRGAQVVATDFADGMLTELSRAAQQEGLTGIDARVMDAQQLALDDGSFDAAFCLFGFMFFPDRARAFGELHRVLRPGGSAVVMTWAPLDRRPLMGIGFQALAEVMPEMPRPQKGDLQEPGECVAELSAAGFRDVTCQSVTATLELRDAAHYAGMLEDTSGPLALMRKKMGEPAWAQLRARFTEAIARRVPEQGPFSLSAEALMTCGVR